MEKTENQEQALILEADTKLVDRIKPILCSNNFIVLSPESTEAAIKMLKQHSIQLAFLGQPPEGGQCFDLLKEIVKASPMTYVILMTDESEKQVHDKAEGFGILGHVSRAFTPNQVQILVDKYRNINQAL